MLGFLLHYEITGQPWIFNNRGDTEIQLLKSNEFIFKVDHLKNSISIFGD